MSHTADNVGHWEDLETWLSVATSSLLPKAAETLKHQTQEQLDDNLTSLMKQDPSQGYNNKELAKITAPKSHLIATLKLSDRRAADLQQELTCAQRRIKQLELEAQEQQEKLDEERKDPEEITTLKALLAASTQEVKQTKRDFDNAANNLQYAEQLLEKAKTDIRDKAGRIKALEAHLNESRNQISRLEQQLDYVKEESDGVKEELRHAYDLRAEPPRTREAPTSPLPTSQRASHGLDLKDLDKIARNIVKFTPGVPSSPDVQTYLQDVEFHLEVRPHVTDKDRLYLLRATSSPDVRSFLDRQPAQTKADYHLLREALIKEFDDPESEQGLVAALEIRQGRHESPQAYYSRLRRAYFGTRNEPEMEQDMNFKTLFLRNLHPGVSHHLGVLACPRTMTIQQLRDLAHKAYSKQKMAAEKGAKAPTVLDFNTQSHGLPLEGAQHQDSFKPSRKEWNASNREQDFHAGTRPKQRNGRWDGPRERQRSPGRHWEKSWNQSTSFRNQRGKSSWDGNGTSMGRAQTHPGATSPRTRRKNFQTESTHEQKTSPFFYSQELMKSMMREFFQQMKEDWKWEKKEKPDSA
ncbi:LOW QUALITY PROTEIN: uncharacterized protein LOC122355310 [Puntigrus tetrazona]|uniref:LOW QUALITY PROTEIN: uncharacterized protein LOC122355310 n=1 Tax=Puntigrus tetrazona TaxID=1606681 RepID=UPI001C8984A6|nr:LOW QUALITY PROTEIN: uncharacterized protein LOC122355310 [Puntigrus tetrazona]